MQELNQFLLTYLNNLLIEYKCLEKIIFLFADTPIFFLPIFLVWFRLYFNHTKNNKWKNILILIFYSTVTAILISLIIQQFVHLDRPEEHLKNTWKLILEHIPDASFPSDHASVSIAFLTAILLFWFRRIWAFLLPFFIVMNLSRVIAWVHWPFDVLAWTIVWIFSALLIYKVQKNNYLVKLNSYIIKLMWYLKL